MISIKFIKSFSLILYLLLINITVLADSGGTSNLYAFPIAELESVISDWLSLSGYKVQREVLEMGVVKISAVKSAENWQFILKPHSALATELQAKSQSGAVDSNDLLKSISEYISSYIETPETKGKTPRQTIPPAVLSHIGSAVCIEATSGDNHIQVSGFIFDRKGLILSTTHNLQHLSEIKVTLHDGREFNGRLIKIDLQKDLALIRVNSAVESFIPLAKARDRIGIGEQIFSIGCPVNLVGTIYPGIVNSQPKRVGQMPFWQVNMNIYPGSSGSPVFDEHGRLVGMVKGRYRGTSSIGFVIPFETIKSFVQEP